MACLYCGKEIGPFRLLRDKEFCCPAHRKGYSARLGKALGQISAQEPPPAPLATFIPYKPFEGTNRTPSQICTLEPFRCDLQLLDTWPLAIVPLGRERTASLPLLPTLYGEQEFSTEPQPWSSDRSLRHLSLDLQPGDAIHAAQSPAEADPAEAGAVTSELPPADWQPDATIEPDQSWGTPEIRIPEVYRTAIRPGAPNVCGPLPGLLADAVEAFLPPGREPEMAAYAAPAAVAMRWAMQPVEWNVAAELAGPAPAAAAEPVESWITPYAQPQAMAWPSNAALPQFALEAAEWVAATELAGPVAAPAAEPVETFLPAFAEPQMVAFPAAPALPQFALEAAEWMAATELAGPVQAAAAQPVESFLPPFAEPQMVAFGISAALPQMALEAADWTVAAEAAEPVAAPAAQAVESFLPPPAEPQIAAWTPAATLLPRLAVGPAAWVLSVDLAEPVAAPAAEAVESLLPALPEPQIAAWTPAAALLPRLNVQAADWELVAALAEPAPGLAAQAVESLLPALAEPVALPMVGAVVRLPDLTLVAVAPEPVEEFAAPLVIADACQDWMPSPPACETVREVIPAFGGPLPADAALPAQAAMSLELPLAAIRWEGDWRPGALAEPVISYVAPRVQPALASNFAVSVPRLASLRKSSLRRAQTLASAAPERYPEPVQPPALEPAAVTPEPAAQLLAMRLPEFAVEHTSGNRTATFRASAPAAAEPGASQPNPGAGAQLTQPSAALVSPASPAASLRCGLPTAPAASGDFICQQTTMAPVKSLHSISSPLAVAAPKFLVRPIFERVEEAVAPPPKPAEKTPAFAEIFEISKAARKSTPLRRGLFSAGKLIAASLIVGLGMWFGAGSVKISRQMLALNSELHGVGSANTSSGTYASGSRNTTASASEGTIAHVRRAIRGRAALELTDTFRRMDAWGSAAMAMPAGWTRNADGYVRTGQLALYRPAQSFSDYRFEFFGEIEKKSMSWAIRAHDPENYYGMKMTVIEPGLRPVVAMVHYAVVGGKKRQKVETPLSIMMHNNEPYHVAVDVKGNRVITSIEGQEVDSWTDDSLKVGGVGFFSEVGESARLYWMRVSKNQDWLGRVCAYLASGSNNNTADLWREELPQTPSQPFTPALPPATDLAATGIETEDFSQMSPQRVRILKHGRTEPCRS